MDHKMYSYIIIALTIMVSNAYAKRPSNDIKYTVYEDAAHQVSKTSPGYNAAFEDPMYHRVKPILFTPEEDIVTGDDSNKNEVGYFWDVQDIDKTLTYKGKARVGNSQYINVVVIDSKKINTTGDEDSAISSSTEDIYHPSDTEKRLFDTAFFTKIGTFMKQNDPTIYVLYGQYVSTVFPDPVIVEYV